MLGTVASSPASVAPELRQAPVGRVLCGPARTRPTITGVKRLNRLTAQAAGASGSPALAHAVASHPFQQQLQQLVYYTMISSID